MYYVIKPYAKRTLKSNITPTINVSSFKNPETGQNFETWRNIRDDIKPSVEEVPGFLLVFETSRSFFYSFIVL